MGRSAAMDDDPLAELERIISGKMPPAPEPESPAPESPAPESFAPEREGEQGGEDAFGDDALEALFESGFEDAFSLEMDGDAAAAPAAATIVETPPQPSSLEDQLMAELDGGGIEDYSAPVPPAPSVAEPRRMSLATPRPVAGNPLPASERFARPQPPAEMQAPRQIGDEAVASSPPADDPLARLEAVARSLTPARTPARTPANASSQAPVQPETVEPEAFEDFSAADQARIDALFSDELVSEGLAERDEEPVQSAIVDEAAFAAQLEDSFEDSFAREFDLDVARSLNGDAADDLAIDPAGKAAGIPSHGVPPLGIPIEAGAAPAKLENHFASAFARELEVDTRQEPPVADDAALPPVPLGTDEIADFGFDTVPDAEDLAAGQPEPAAETAAIAAGEKGARGGFRMALGALAIALLAGIGVVAWGALGDKDATIPSDTPVIRADTEPAKVKPEEPGGAVIANQDNQVYERVAGGKDEEPVQEELITTREEPVEIASKTDARLSPQAVEDDEGAPALGLAPKRVRTVVVKPDGTILSNAEEPGPAQAGEPAIGQLALASPQDATAGQDTSLMPPAGMSSGSSNNAADAQQPSDPGTIAIDGSVEARGIAIPTPSPRAPSAPAPQAAEAPQAPAAAPEPTRLAAATPEPAAPRPDSNAPTVASSEWKIQVSSQRSREAAEASFNNIRQRFASVLDGRTAAIERADVEGKGTFYRVKVLAQSKSEAADICDRLKSAGGSCFVTR